MTPVDAYLHRYPVRALRRPAAAGRDRGGARAASRRCSSPTSRSACSTSASAPRSSTCSRRWRASRGSRVVMITHDLSTVAAYADRIAVMYLGRIVEHRADARGARRAAPSVRAGAPVGGAGAGSVGAPPPGHPARRDARSVADPVRLPLPPTLPVRVRPMPDGRSAAVRRRAEPPGRLPAGGGASRRLHEHRRRGCPPVTMRRTGPTAPRAPVASAAGRAQPRRWRHPPSRPRRPAAAANACASVGEALPTCRSPAITTPRMTTTSAAKSPAPSVAVKARAAPDLRRSGRGRPGREGRRHEIGRRERGRRVLGGRDDEPGEGHDRSGEHAERRHPGQRPRPVLGILGRDDLAQADADRDEIVGRVVASCGRGRAQRGHRSPGGGPGFGLRARGPSSPPVPPATRSSDSRASMASASSSGIARRRVEVVVHGREEAFAVLRDARVERVGIGEAPARRARAPRRAGRPRRRSAAASADACEVALDEVDLRAVVARDEVVADGIAGIRAEQVAHQHQVARATCSSCRRRSCSIPACVHQSTNGRSPVAPSDWASSDSWCGKRRSRAAAVDLEPRAEVGASPWPSTRCASPGGPDPTATATTARRASDRCHSTKSRGSRLPGMSGTLPRSLAIGSISSRDSFESSP